MPCLQVSKRPLLDLVLLINRNKIKHLLKSSILKLHFINTVNTESSILKLHFINTVNTDYIKTTHLILLIMLTDI